MKTKADLERLAKAWGATLEEDQGWRDMRTFQIVAPEGQRWLDGHVLCIKVEWAKGAAKHAVRYNEDEWQVIKEAVECGLEPIPAEDAYLYAVD